MTQTQQFTDSVSDTDIEMCIAGDNRADGQRAIEKITEIFCSYHSTVHECIVTRIHKSTLAPTSM